MTNYLMTKREKTLERRKHKRFQVPRDAFVGVGPYFNKVGPITDMSIDGLAFRYIGSEEPSNRSHKLDIFLTDGDFYLGKIPFETISDLEIVNKAPSSSITMRRSSVQFRKLTHYQISQLESFIQIHCEVETKSRLALLR